MFISNCIYLSKTKTNIKKKLKKKEKKRKEQKKTIMIFNVHPKIADAVPS